MNILISIVLLSVFTGIGFYKLIDSYTTSIASISKEEYDRLTGIILGWMMVVLLCGFGWLSLFG